MLLLVLVVIWIVDSFQDLQLGREVEADIVNHLTHGVLEHCLQSLVSGQTGVVQHVGQPYKLLVLVVYLLNPGRVAVPPGNNIFASVIQQTAHLFCFYIHNKSILHNIIMINLFEKGPNES